MNTAAIQRQKGVALISVLLVFSLVTILVSSRVTRDGLDIRRSGFHLHHSQATQYALGGEALARQILSADWQQDSEKKLAVDHQLEEWYQTADFSPDRGRMQVEIRDLQSRFNLNNLLNSEGKPDTTQRAIFVRLLDALQLPTDNIDAVIDWLDADNEPLTNISEDSALLSSELPYRSADQKFADGSELQTLKVFNAGELQELLPYVSTLPRFSALNVNTASEAVLSAVHPELNAADTISDRDNKPFESVSQFLLSELTAGLIVDDSIIAVNSEYFEVRVVAQLEEVIVHLRTVLHRQAESGKITTLSRTFMEPYRMDSD